MRPTMSDIFNVYDVDPETVAVCADAAADLLTHNGWVQDTMTRGGAFCLVGAIYEVCCSGAESASLTWAVKDHLGFPTRSGDERLVSWNDTYGREAGEVIDALRLTAKQIRENI